MSNGVLTLEECRKRRKKGTKRIVISGKALMTSPSNYDLRTKMYDVYIYKKLPFRSRDGKNVVLVRVFMALRKKEDQHGEVFIDARDFIDLLGVNISVDDALDLLYQAQVKDKENDEHYHNLSKFLQFPLKRNHLEKRDRDKHFYPIKVLTPNGARSLAELLLPDGDWDIKEKQTISDFFSGIHKWILGRPKICMSLFFDKKGKEQNFLNEIESMDKRSKEEKKKNSKNHQDMLDDLKYTDDKIQFVNRTKVDEVKPPPVVLMTKTDEVKPPEPGPKPVKKKDTKEEKDEDEVIRLLRIIIEKLNLLLEK